ncbi:hypothetical protein JXA40_07710 [bacterium]|nr:hypothetical protein [candidate division CSSED10-310 bacterium]
MLKTMLDYILVEQRLEWFFLHLAWIGPSGGLVLGIIAGLTKRRLWVCIRSGLIWGFGATLISVMWWIYNAILDHYGIDSVKGLLINLLLFALVGCLLGTGVRIVMHRSQKIASRDSETPNITD